MRRFIFIIAVGVVFFCVGWLLHILLGTWMSRMGLLFLALHCALCGDISVCVLFHTRYNLVLLLVFFVRLLLCVCFV